MSRIISIDLTEGLEANDPDDLRYALDRNMFDAEDAQRVREYLDGNPESPEEEGPEMDPEYAAELLALLKGSVGEVNKNLDDTELDEQDLRYLAANETRSGVLNHIQSLMDSLGKSEADDPTINGSNEPAGDSNQG